MSTRTFATSARVLAALSLAAAAGASAQEVPDAWPDWLKEAMAAESADLEYHSLDLGEGYLTSKMAGKLLSDAAEIEDGWYLTSDIGSPTPFECWIFRTATDPASMATNIADISVEANVEENGALQSRNIYFLDVGEIDGAPFLALEWFYGLGEAPNTVLGLSKVRVALKGEATIACGHNMVGHRETFAAAFEQLVRDAEIPSNGDGPEYEEIHRYSVGDQSIGFAHSTFALDADGDTGIQRIEAMILPLDSSTVSTSDGWTMEYSRPDGTIINQLTAESENGELTTNLELSRNEVGTWVVSGTFQGKEIEGEIDSDAEPLSELGQMNAVARLIEDDDRDADTFAAWVPQADPLSFIDGTVRMSGDGEGGGAIEIGPIEVNANFDRIGSLRQGSMAAGAVTIAIDRIWQRGELP